MLKNLNSSTLNDSNFNKLVLESKKPVLVEFSTDWCGASHLNASVLQDMALKYKNEISLYHIDVTKYKNITEKYGIQQIPTILSFHNGQIVDHTIGALPRRVIVKKILDLIRKNRIFKG